jgi:hypothetical protein
VPTHLSAYPFCQSERGVDAELADAQVVHPRAERRAEDALGDVASGALNKLLDGLNIGRRPAGEGGGHGSSGGQELGSEKGCFSDKLRVDLVERGSQRAKQTDARCRRDREMRTLVPSSGVAPESGRLGGARVELPGRGQGLPARSRTSIAWLRRPGPEKSVRTGSFASEAGVEPAFAI